MSQKLLVPVGAAVLVVAGILTIWLLLPKHTPQVSGSGNDAPTESPADSTAPLDASPDDLSAERLTPDPVVTERPPQPFDTTLPARRFLVSGRVVTATGIGVAGAEVQFVGEQKLRDWSATGFSDDAGYYRILAWAADPRGTVAGDAFGRVAAVSTDGAIAVGPSTKIAEGDEVIFPDLVLPESRVIEGQVLSESGQPVPGAQVTARSAGRVEVATLRGRSPSIANRPYVTSVVSDSTGRYSFPHMPAGEYALTVEAGYAGEKLERTIADIRNAPSVWQDLTVTLNNYVRGVVVDQGGQPVPGVIVQLRAKPVAADAETPADPADVKGKLEAVNPRDSVRRFDDDARFQRNTRFISVTDAAGRFGFGNRSDAEYELVTRVAGKETVLENVRINQPDYRLEIRVDTVVSGIVRDARTGLPVESYDARLLPGEGPEDVNPFQRVAPDGRFAYHPGGVYLFANPPARPSRVQVSAAGYAPAVINLRDLAAGEARRNVDIELLPLCDVSLRLTLEGRGLDFEPVALLYDGHLAFAGSSDELGTARLNDVAPQTYEVRVVRADGTRLFGTLVVPAMREAELEVKLKPAE